MTEHGGIVGAGWGFPTAVSKAGAVRLVTGTDELDAAIRMILSTVPGERVMRPEFGCAMWTLVFAPLTDGTLGLIEQAVREAVERWEPRVALDRVEAVVDPAGDAGTVLVELDYRIRATNDPRNLVYPFYAIPHEEGAS